MTRVSDRELFSGYGLSPIDAKGRVAIPPDLRSTIEKNSAERLFIMTEHDCDPCLIGYDRDWANLLAEEIARDEAFERSAGRSFDRHNARRRAFAITDLLPFDTSGRFVLNGFLRDDMKLTSFAFFAGVGNVFEVWNPQTLLDAANVDDRIKRACRWHLAQKGLA